MTAWLCVDVVLFVVVAPVVALLAVGLLRPLWQTMRSLESAAAWAAQAAQSSSAMAARS